MKSLWCLVATAGVALAAAGAAAEDVAGLPLHIEKVGTSAIRLWVGDVISSTAPVAMPTKKGILVIDTTGNPPVDRELRRIIARELGRNDFKYLINTHEHSDHTGANAVYADCTIIGHEAIAAGMAAQEAERPRYLEWATRHATELEHELQVELGKQPVDAAATKKLREQLTLSRLNLDRLQSGEKGLPPTKTFADRMQLDCGDTHVEMFWIGGMHSASDIAIFVPEQRLLLTGDTMADTWLTDTPGCLASFAARSGVPHDFPRWIRNWNTILAKKDRIETFVPGHWNGTLSEAGAEARVGYVKTLWDGIGQGAAAGRSLSDLTAEYSLKERFPALAESPGFSTQNHYMTVLEMWSTVTKQESAADRLYALIDAGAHEDAIHEIVAARDAKPATYYFLEAQINYSGYRFLQEGKTAQAIALFRINVELFPGSWNVYDSLGEALLKSGDVDGAAAMYEKSLELKPDSQSAKDALTRIRAQRAAR